MSAEADEGFMRRAIELARARVGLTGANPSVGVVMVKDSAVMGEAATADGGRPHAEEQALAALGERARGATAYVTMEPCGQRSSGAPSCAERLIAAGVIRVVYACGNPHHLSAGGGPARLAAAGVILQSGLLADEASALYSKG